MKSDGVENRGSVQQHTTDAEGGFHPENADRLNFPPRKWGGVLE